VTAVKVSLVDVYVLRGRGAAAEFLVLRRASGVVRPGSWETVHGRIEDGETPDRAALRELREETGIAPLRFYNLSRVESFYLHRSDEVALIPAFVALAPPGAEPALSEEHDRAEWLSPEAARTRFTWPRERRAIDDAVILFGTGDAGTVEDVLRIC
jgi:dihydroneopterin triphosphate diphosphatase